MAITAAYNLEAQQYNAISAFTNSILHDVVYIECPDSFKEQNICLLLQQALYGLRQSPLLWLEDLTSMLSTLGLQQINEEYCLFTNGKLILFFYVDDIVVLYKKGHQRDFEHFIRQLMKRYELRDMGNLSWFLGIR